jgi:hypothetical protein
MAVTATNARIAGRRVALTRSRGPMSLILPSLRRTRPLRTFKAAMPWPFLKCAIRANGAHVHADGGFPVQPTTARMADRRRRLAQ